MRVKVHTGAEEAATQPAVHVKDPAVQSDELEAHVIDALDPSEQCTSAIAIPCYGRSLAKRGPAAVQCIESSDTASLLTHIYVRIPHPIGVQKTKDIHGALGKGMTFTAH